MADRGSMKTARLAGKKRTRNGNTDEEGAIEISDNQTTDIFTVSSPESLYFHLHLFFFAISLTSSYLFIIPNTIEYLIFAT